MGVLLDTGDERMSQDKQTVKESLQRGDAEDRKLAALLARTSEQRNLEEENQQLRKKIEELERQLSERQ